jgi:CRP/FNR family transcriptional regulator, cyclic AMP receptor protein
MSSAPVLIHLLDEDPDLAAGISANRMPLARQRAVAYVVGEDPGPADFLGAYGAAAGWLGLLLLDGLVLQHAAVLDRTSTQVLAPGDVFCPWEFDQECALQPSAITFEVIAPSRLALLDDEFAARVRPWPQIASALIGRAARRAHGFTVAHGLATYPRVDVRVVALLWHLAERCGVALADETVVLPLALTPWTIARIVGCEPGLVRSALGTMRREGLVSPTAGGWLLSGTLSMQIEFLLARAKARPLAVVASGAHQHNGSRSFRSSSTG